MLVLGIETSCDETAAAIVEDGKKILSNIVSSQVKIHKKFWGVVPEIASRKHIEMILPVIQESLNKAGISLEEVDGIAATFGPGLLGSLLVGLTVAKGIAYARNLPFIGINHLEAHLYACFIEHPHLIPPFIGLIISGGHTELIYISKQRKYELLGSTRDDAVGEAFDKVARILGLEYPGGPAIEKLAKKGNPYSIPLPLSHFKDEKTLDFSFSGIKTAVLYYVENLRRKGKTIPVENLAASFELKVSEMLIKRVNQAINLRGVNKVVVAGGVSSNQFLRSFFEKRKPEGAEFFFPSQGLCTDNAAMIGICGYYKFKEGKSSPLSLDANPSLKLFEGGNRASPIPSEFPLPQR